MKPVETEIVSPAAVPHSQVVNSTKICCPNFTVVQTHNHSIALVTFTVNSDSLDAIEIENRSHVLRQRRGIGPHEVICDRNNVLLPSQGGDYLLQHEG